MAVRITRAGLGLTVGIIVLALVVLGGLYLAKERGEQARREDALEVAQQNLESQSGTGTLTPSIDGEVEESGTPSEETESEVVEESTESANGNGGESVTEEEVAVEETVTEQSPDELPQTGADEAMAIIAVALLAFAGISYWQSRKALFEAR